MRRNRSGVAGSSSASTIANRSSTSVLNHNSNSNSCSNDTSVSTLSTSTALSSSVPLNPILQSENKIRCLLKDLQTYVKKYDAEREKSEANLTNVNKTHEKIRKEEKLSVMNRKKIRSLYLACLKDSENETICLRQTLDCINQVRLTQNELRLLQNQQHSPLSHSLLLATPPHATNNNGSLVSFSGVRLSPNSPSKINNAHHEHGASNKSSNNQLNQSIELDPKSFKKIGTANMRRGVLMSILQQAALTLPLWIGEIDQSPPPLCGRIPPETNYICKPGDRVAAIVKSSNSQQDADQEDWILAEVVAYHANSGKYDVDDVDAEEGQERHTLPKKRVVPLPLWRANPVADPQALFEKDSMVLALYPQTTCFYRGIVAEAPQTPLEDYQIMFEDNTYPEGYSPSLNVPQLYVVADRS